MSRSQPKSCLLPTSCFGSAAMLRHDLQDFIQQFLGQGLVELKSAAAAASSENA